MAETNGHRCGPRALSWLTKPAHALFELLAHSRNPVTLNQIGESRGLGGGDPAPCGQAGVVGATSSTIEPFGGAIGESRSASSSVRNSGHTQAAGHGGAALVTEAFPCPGWAGGWCRFANSTTGSSAGRAGCASSQHGSGVGAAARARAAAGLESTGPSASGSL